MVRKWLHKHELFCKCKVSQDLMQCGLLEEHVKLQNIAREEELEESRTIILIWQIDWLHLPCINKYGQELQCMKLESSMEAPIYRWTFSVVKLSCIAIAYHALSMKLLSQTCNGDINSEIDWYWKAMYIINFSHDRPWISPWIKVTSNELDIAIHVITSRRTETEWVRHGNDV